MSRKLQKRITAQDCNDNDLTINPSAMETAYGIDGKDNDCNGVIDDCSSVNSPISAQIYCDENGIMRYEKGTNIPTEGNSPVYIFNFKISLSLFEISFISLSLISLISFILYVLKKKKRKKRGL